MMKGVVFLLPTIKRRHNVSKSLELSSRARDAVVEFEAGRMSISDFVGGFTFVMVPSPDQLTLIQQVDWTYSLLRQIEAAAYFLREHTEREKWENWVRCNQQKELIALLIALREYLSREPLLASDLEILGLAKVEEVVNWADQTFLRLAEWGLGRYEIS